jgi:heme exporter protein D
MALLISIGNLSGIAGGNIYLAQEAPHFWTGYGFSLGIMVATIIMTLVLRRDYIKENARRDAMSEDEINAKYTEDELLALGDRSSYFRYSFLGLATRSDWPLRRS